MGVSKDGSEAVKLELKKILDSVLCEPTHIKYWNAYKKLQRLDLDLLEIPNEKRVKVAMLSSFTIEPLSMYIDIKSRFNGLYPELYVGSFNQVTQEVLDGNSQLYAFSPDVIILALQAESLLDGYFYSNFINLSKNDKERTQEEIVSHFKSIISELISRTSSIVLLTNFVVPVFSPLGFFDSKIEKGLKAFFQELNEILADLYRDNRQVFVVDLDGVASKHGKSRCVNYEMYYRGSFLFSESFLPIIAEEFMGYIKALKNVTRKCIVLDLDNTLWGGVLGEEGFNGIRLGKDPPGNAYVDFQKILLSYYNRGVILAINSSNNFGEVIRVLKEHPYMVLREKHFAAMRVNWQNKVENMIELAGELGIGLDSMVFVDDLAQNRELIKKTLPQVLVVDMPSSCYLYRQIIEDLNDFNTLALTEEDLQRGKMYQARKEREQLKCRFSLEEFLSSLQTKAVVEQANEFNLPRITSLVNKTNQFNLTSRRFTNIEIKEMSENKNEFSIYSLQIRDKFGDEGIVGVAIVRKNFATWSLDSFLISCRVIGRGVEDAFLARIALDAKKNGATTLIGEYIPTEKNEAVKFFYKNHGFEKFDEEGNLSRWKTNLNDNLLKIPKWVQMNGG